MTYKIKISKPTYNVFTEVDPDNLIFSSDYDTLKYYTTGDVNLEYDYEDYYYSEEFNIPFNYTMYYHRAEETYTHNLGYKPFFSVYLLDYPEADDAIQMPYYFGDFLSFSTINAYSDNSKLYFVYYAGIEGGNSGSISLDFRYRIFRNDTGL